MTLHLQLPIWLHVMEIVFHKLNLASMPPTRWRQIWDIWCIPLVGKSGLPIFWLNPGGMMLEEGIRSTELVANQETVWWQLSVTVCVVVCIYNTDVHYIEKAQYSRIAIPQLKDSNKEENAKVSILGQTSSSQFNIGGLSQHLDSYLKLLQDPKPFRKTNIFSKENVLGTSGLVDTQAINQSHFCLHI